jgi:hypothetical protein
MPSEKDEVVKEIPVKDDVGQGQSSDGSKGEHPKALDFDIGRDAGGW